MPHARKGKIARLPLAIRDEVCRRLQDGQSAPQILPWLNEQPDTVRVVNDLFDAEPVTPQNLSEWRLGGYKDWERRRENLEHTKELNAAAARIAENGGDLLAGSTAVAAGQVMQMLEGLDIEAQKDLLLKEPATYLELIGQLAKLQKSGADARRAKHAGKAVALAEEKLDLERAKFQRHTCELFIKWVADQRAKDIAEGKDKAPVKIEKLRQLMFGDLTAAEGQAA